ncbi:unnamed protein product [Cylindrotheca closterium]|uniref:Uncharacterized protein n=1 Tax=Cylindrotheca closterium TaxID=2856 RepID=A0AAD2CUF4_9STRA|nr:unnamed protein product [Cylindrotheca closterium]
MKFKPQCQDYHSEATSLWLERYPNKETEPLRIHTKLLEQEENEVSNEVYEKEVDEASNEREQEPPISNPLMDSFKSQANGSPSNARASNAKKKVSKSNLSKAEANSSTPSRHRRRKRRRDSQKSLSPTSEKKISEASLRSKDHTEVPATNMPSCEEPGLRPTVEENPLQGDPRNGQRRWLRRKLPTAASQSEPSSLEATEEISTERPSQPCVEHEAMDCDLDASQMGESRTTLVPPIRFEPQQCPQEMMECNSSLQMDLVKTIQREEDYEMQPSSDISHDETGPQDMIVEHSDAYCSSPGVDRVRRRQRRLVNAICGSTLGSKGIIVLPPKLFSIYDSPLLVSIWTNIRRSANRKRIANYAWWLDSSQASQSVMIEEIETRASFWRQPMALPYLQCLISFWWRRRAEIAFFRQFSRTISNVAMTQLDHVVSVFTLRHLSDRRQGQRPISIKLRAIPKNAKAKKDLSKLPYRYCLLDILQGNAGTFWNVSLGPSSKRRETLKRELKAIVLYNSKPQNPSLEVQQRLQFAILFAWNLANRQKEERHEEQDTVEGQCSTENQPVLPEKRKALDETGLLPPNKWTMSKLLARSKTELADSTSHHSNDLRLHETAEGSSPPDSTKKQSAKGQRQKEIGQARQTELSLLERFGLAPSTEPTGNGSNPTKGRKKRPPPPIISPEEVPQSKRGKRQARQQDISESSHLEIAPSSMQCDDPVSLHETRKATNVNDVILPEQNDKQINSPKQFSVLSPQGHQPPSCQPMSKVASCRKLDDRSEHYRNWQPKNFDLDGGSVWSFNNDNDSDIQLVTAPNAFDPESNLPSSVGSPSEGLIQNTAHQISQHQTTSRVVSDKKQRKRARKAAKKKKKKESKRKSGKRKKKKQSHGDLFEQSLPESVLQSLEEDATEEVRPCVKENGPTTTHQVTATAQFGMEIGSPDQPIVIDDTEDSALTSLPPQTVRPPLVLLCSEDFLEKWGDYAARLVSGDWQHQVSSRRTNGTSSGRRFCFVDTKLVDTCGVDIELPDRGGIVVSALSSWFNDDGFESLIMRIIGLISSTRFRHLSIFLCADIDQDDATIDRISTIQSAVLHQGEGLTTATSFTLVSPNTLAASIGQSICKLDAAWGLEEAESWLLDDRTFERLLFLVRLVPTLTVTSILQCLMSSPVATGSTEDKSRLWFQSVFQDDRERKRMKSFDPKVLHPAVITQLSFALGINIGDKTVFQS